MAIAAFRRVAGWLRHGAMRSAGGAREPRGNGLRRRFLPVVDAFVEAQRLDLGLTAGETHLLRRAWLEHVDGGDPRGAVLQLLTSFRQRRGGNDEPVASGPSSPDGGDDAVHAAWREGLDAFLLEVLALAGRAACRPAMAVCATRARMRPVVTQSHRPRRGRDPPGHPRRHDGTVTSLP